jgi:hypothetical protein
MTDVRSRLQELDGLPAPDLWAQIQSRAVGGDVREFPETPNRSSVGRRARAALLAAVVFGVAGIFAWHAFRPLREAVPSTRPSAHDVWSTLHRPLALPIATAGSCPSSPVVRIKPVGGGFSGHGAWPARGRGPVFVVAEPASRFVPLRPRDKNAQGWYGLKTILVVSPSYRGPLLVRTEQLVGTGGIGFGPSGEDAPTLSELQLDEPTNGIDWRSWPTVTLVRSSGCFAYQVDGTTFTEVIVFKARAH